ncbi:MAG: type II CAAX endopeptidase family protein [Desulforegulaceae bacterium]|nr:type II CAAX endopeptidase family protein [Desulforegulaceae bacterium]
MVCLQLREKNSFKINGYEISIIFGLFFLIELFVPQAVKNFSNLSITLILRALDLLILGYFFYSVKKVNWFLKKNYIQDGIKKGVYLSFFLGILFFLIYFFLNFFFNFNIFYLFNSPLSPDFKNLILLLAAGGLIGPIVEELLFRGILYNFLRQNGKIIVSVFLSSLIFSFFHLNQSSIPIIQFTGGVVFACSYEYTKNIFVPSTIHITGNLFILSIPYLLKTGWF